MKCSLLALIISFFCFSIFAQLNQVDAKGKKQGEWGKLYDGTKVFLYKGQFVNDKPVGKFTYYYPSSKVKAVIKHDPNSNRSVAYYYHDNGALMSYGIFRNQLKDSVWLNFGPSQRISNTETFKNGKLEGKKVIYYVPELASDKSQIPSTISYYKNDMLDGDYTEYFDGKNVKVKGVYSLGKKEGVWTHYSTSGKPMMILRYQKGVMHGWAFGYDDAGKEIGKKYYYHGRHLEGKILEEKMRQMKELGINPNE